MKMLTVAVFLAASSALGWAQTASFEAQQTRPDPRQPVEAERKGPPMDGKPVPTGIIYMMSKDGLQVINPAAPMRYGVGREVLSETTTPQAIPGTVNDDPKPLGGIRFFGWLF
ncbi:MAG: hypothetical protein OHK005_08400 [Candidatus Methylacidiphilales bacterium]